MPENDTENRLQGLAALISGSGETAARPVETWDPPYCGDIGLAILSDGTWLYRGSPIQRPALVKLFASVLRKDADGRTYLVTPAEKVDVTVSDAPFLAVEMETATTDAGRTLLFRTNVDDVVTCGPEHPLRFSVDDVSGAVKPYIRVRGRLEALLTRALTHELLEDALTQNPPGIRSGGLHFVLPPIPD
jgi:hypothetical protein